MKYAAFIFCLLMVSCSQKQEPKLTKIRVTGEGKIKAKPNQVTFTLNVSFVKPKMADAVAATQQTVDSVMVILTKFSTSENDIKTSSISANKEYTYNGRNSVFAGYQASQSINFVLNDINKFTDLTGKLLATKISSISQIQFSHSKADSILREADLLAYDDALKSANKLCKRANVTLGNVLFMSNSNGGYIDNNYDNDIRLESRIVSQASGNTGFRISPEVMEFRRTIVSEYEIIP